MSAKHFGLRNTHKNRARAVGAFVPELTKKAFQKYGFSVATILTDWPAIVGSDLAAITRPERLKWSRSKHETNSFNEQKRGDQGASLILRVEPSRALDVQYKSAAIKERINSYFGYCAVSEIRLLQAPIKTTTSNPVCEVKQKKIKPATTPAERENFYDKLTSKDQLLDTLTRLQFHVSNAESLNKRLP